MGFELPQQDLAQDPRGVLRQGEIIRQRLLSSDEVLTPGRWVQGTLTREELASESRRGDRGADRHRLAGWLGWG